MILEFDNGTEEILKKYLVEHKEDINQDYIEPKEGDGNDSYDSELVQEEIMMDRTVSLTHDASMSEFDDGVENIRATKGLGTKKVNNVELYPEQYNANSQLQPPSTQDKENKLSSAKNERSRLNEKHKNSETWQKILNDNIKINNKKQDKTSKAENGKAGKSGKNDDKGKLSDEQLDNLNKDI